MGCRRTTINNVPFHIRTRSDAVMLTEVNVLVGDSYLAIESEALQDGSLHQIHLKQLFHVCPSSLCVPLSLTRVLLHPGCPSHLGPRGPFATFHRQLPTIPFMEDKASVIPDCSLLCVCHFRLFVLPASVCITSSKLNPQLKWKSSRHPSGFRAITSCSWRRSCHFCCSSEVLMAVLPFSPPLCHKH